MVTVQVSGEAESPKQLKYFFFFHKKKKIETDQGPSINRKEGISYNKQNM